MKVVVVDNDNDSTWVPQITGFARDLDIMARCASVEVESGNMEATYPNEDLVQIFVEVHDAMALALLDGEQVVGYILSSAEGYVKWAGIKPGYEEHWSNLTDLVKARYGRVWGRVTNPTMRQSIVDNVEYIVPRSDDNAVIGDFEA